MTLLETLTPDQVSFYREQGYLVLENRIPMDAIEAIRAEISRFEDEARSLTQSNDRIDLEESHTPDNPRLRRIKLPHTTSRVVGELLYSDHVLAPVRDLIGADLRLHTTKLNMKSAGFGAAIEWHQDFAFYPHTNDDVLAVGVIIDDMVSENGPLKVFPGSHRGPIHDHHADGVFVGACGPPGLRPRPGRRRGTRRNGWLDLDTSCTHRARFGAQHIRPGPPIAVF